MSDFEKIGKEVGELVQEKNTAYGNSFENAAKILKVLFPNGVKPVQYKDMLAIVRILDKLNRICSDKYAFEEDPWKDIVGYGILSLASQKKKEKNDGLRVKASKGALNRIEKDIKHLKDVDGLIQNK